MTFSFEIIKEYKKIRLSKINLSSSVELPRFMPVATYASMKGVPFDHLDTNLFLCNAYHCRKLTNLKEFMTTNKNILTDSGGFQIGSLKGAKVTEEGVLFDDDGVVHLFTPEESIRTQIRLNSDIIMQLDDVVNPKSDYETVKSATLRSIRWLKRCLSEFSNFNSKNEKENKRIKRENPFLSGNQLLMPIIQGGLFSDLRESSIKSILEFNPPAVAIGGLCGGEDKISMFRTIFECVSKVKGVPVYVMGIGYPDDVLISFALGCDMMDCVYPTRTARFGKMFDYSGDINLLKNKEAVSLSHLDCKCFTCLNYSLEYLYLIRNTANFCSLVSIHNLYFMNELGNSVRKSILESNFDEFVKEFFNKRFSEEVPQWIKEVLSWVDIDF